MVGMLADAYGGAPTLVGAPAATAVDPAPAASPAAGPITGGLSGPLVLVVGLLAGAVLLTQVGIRGEIEVEL